MSPGSRASVWCNAARAHKNAKGALELAQQGRQIDSGTENPHYEFDLLRYARAAGENTLAKRYEAEVKELMEVPRPSSFQFSQMSLRAEDLMRTFSDAPVRDSPQYRARMEEAALLWKTVYKGWCRGLNRPRICRALLGRAEAAERLGEFGRAYECATTAYLLSGERPQDKLRYAAKAGEFREKLESKLDYKACRSHGANGKAVAHQVSRPHPLIVSQEL
jgi:hypothetical protein